MRRVLALVIVALGVVMLSPPSAQAAGCVFVGLDGISAECVWTYAEYAEESASGDGHTWVVVLQCANGGICNDHLECQENGEAGFVHDVYVDGVDVGDVCVPEGAVDENTVVQLILREYKRIHWPASRLVVQPRGGKTLVNLPTNFYTDEHSPILREFNIAKRRVDIRATPVTFTFHFGDGESLASRSPGRPHPNLDVTHIYSRVDEVAVALDTTYTGEFRIGDGDWVPIDQAVTVAGEEQDLAILEALPQLVVR